MTHRGHLRPKRCSSTDREAHRSARRPDQEGLAAEEEVATELRRLDRGNAQDYDDPCDLHQDLPAVEQAEQAEEQAEDSAEGSAVTAAN